jgi:hypothetical protein
MASAPSTFDCTTAATLTGPNGTPTVTAKPGVSFNPTSPASAADWNFNFDGLGQPITAAGVAVSTQRIALVNASDVIVEAVTGYVHD